MITAPIQYFGVSGGLNFLDLVQPTGATLQTNETFSPIQNVGQGAVSITGAGTQTVLYQNVTKIIDEVPVTNALVQTTNGDDAVALTNASFTGPIATGFGLSINNEPIYFFYDKTNLTVNTGSGNDNVNIAALVPSSAGSNPLNSISVISSGTPNSDTLVVTGTTGSDAVNYTPSTTIGSGSVTVNTEPQINFSGITGVAYDGQGGGDTLTLGDAGNLLFAQFTAGATADSGNLTMQFGYSGPSATPLSFSNLGFSGGLSIPGGGFGSLDINGITQASNFTLSSAGVVQIFKPLGGAPVTVPITTTDAAVRLIGHSGNDIFNVPGNQPFAFGLQVQGAAGNNTLNFTGDGTAPSPSISALEPSTRRALVRSDSSVLVRLTSMPTAPR